MAVGTFAAIIHKKEYLYVAECNERGTVSQDEREYDIEGWKP